jgi:hypothetical protein
MGYIDILLEIVIGFGREHLLEQTLSLDKLWWSLRLQSLELLDRLIGFHLSVNLLFDLRNVHLTLLHHVRSVLLLSFFLFFLIGPRFLECFLLLLQLFLLFFNVDKNLHMHLKLALV